APLICCFCATTPAPSAITHAPATAARVPRIVSFVMGQLSLFGLEVDEAVQGPLFVVYEGVLRARTRQTIVVEQERRCRVATGMREPPGEADDGPLLKRIFAVVRFVVVVANQHFRAVALLVEERRRPDRPALGMDVHRGSVQLIVLIHV